MSTHKFDQFTKRCIRCGMDQREHYASTTTCQEYMLAVARNNTQQSDNTKPTNENWKPNPNVEKPTDKDLENLPNDIMAGKQKPTCATCTYYDEGICRRLPPKHYPDKDYEVWPEPYENDWCGEHQKRKK